MTPAVDEHAEKDDTIVYIDVSVHVEMGTVGIWSRIRGKIIAEKRESYRSTTKRRPNAIKGLLAK